MLFDWIVLASARAFEETILSYVFICCLLLIPACFLGLVLHGGKWGFIGGMFIGSSLGYVFFPLTFPLWLPLVVLVAMVALVYQGARS